MKQAWWFYFTINIIGCLLSIFKQFCFCCVCIHLMSMQVCLNSKSSTTCIALEWSFTSVCSYVNSDTFFCLYTFFTDFTYKALFPLLITNCVVIFNRLVLKLFWFIQLFSLSVMIHMYCVTSDVFETRVT